MAYPTGYATYHNSVSFHQEIMNTELTFKNKNEEIKAERFVKNKKTRNMEAFNNQKI